MFVTPRPRPHLRGVVRGWSKTMRHFTLAIAAATMLGLGAAQAAQPAVKGHQPGAREHQQPTAHRILAAAERSGDEVRVTSHLWRVADGGSGAAVQPNHHMRRLV
jgi:formate-dependent phosphoribosylglycinamide formyltransferase (GAR transformylase)